jgi:hypothetical protein
MIFERNDLVARALKHRITDSSVGVLLKDIADVDPGQICNVVASELNRMLKVAAINYEYAPPNEDVEIAEDVETAVKWRSTPELAGCIVVFVKGEVPKLHSLKDLDVLTTRDITRTLVALAKSTLAENAPQRAFWDALSEMVDYFPLTMVEDFVHSVSENQGDSSAIPDNLWRLGLLTDTSFFDVGSEPKDRIVKNRELLLRVSMLSEESRKRIGVVLSKTTGAEHQALKRTSMVLKDYFLRGTRESLKELEFKRVQELIEKGRPLPRTGVSGTEGQEGNGGDGQERPLRGQELQQLLAEFVVRADTEAESSLNELGESIQTSLNAGEIPNDLNVAGFEGRHVSPEAPESGLRSLMGYACAPDSWGGTLETEWKNIKDAIRHCSPESFKKYNPDNPEHGVAGQTVFSLLRELDASYLRIHDGFGAALESLFEARATLLQQLDLLTSYPLVLFGGYPDARQSLKQYIAAYSKILSLYREHEATLHGIDPEATRFIGTELLRLEVVYIKCPDDDWKAILTPLHPFHLWRFREILDAVHGQAPSSQFTDEEKEELASVLPHLPHLLHYIVVSPEVVSRTDVFLPQAGSIGLLPFYENHSNRYLGNDGVDYLRTIIERWLDYAPYSAKMIRLALVDVPDIHYVLSSLTSFLLEHKQTSLHIQLFTTRGQFIEGTLASLDYDQNDHEIAGLMLEKRLTIKASQADGIPAVIDQMKNSPVHISCFFDQSEYQVNYSPRAQFLVVSPLVITYEYEYSPSFKRGAIVPSSEAMEGLFSDYHFLVERAAPLPAGQQIRLRWDPGVNLTPLNSILTENTARWLMIADRSLTAYSITDAIPLDESRKGQREIGVFTEASSRAVLQFINLLRGYNLNPDATLVADILQRFGHIAAGGLISLLGSSGSARALRSQQKGLIGTILAAEWYRREYPGSLVASLDSNLARQWLRDRITGDQRCDLIGLRISSDAVIVEPIEVKTQETLRDLSVIRDDETGAITLAGRAAEQVHAIVDTLEPVFGADDPQPLFTPARREAVKYQLHRECFRNLIEPDDQERWYQTMKQMFAIPEALVNVKVHGLIIHVQLGQSGTTTAIDDAVEPLTFVSLTSSRIQELLSTEGETSEVNSPERQEVELEERREPAQAVSTLVEPVRQAEGNRQEHSVDEEQAEAVQAGSDQDQIVLRDIARQFRLGCQSFQIRIDDCDPSRAIVGPTVYRFYVRLAPGQRLSNLIGSLQDVGREMRRSGLLVTSLPNSNEVALDIPRTPPEIVRISRGLECLPNITSIEQLPIAIGVTPEGHDIIERLDELPHLLVGGTTGSGKTRFLWAILAALLETHPEPSSLRLILSTSAPEDFAYFEGLLHIEHDTIITDAQQAIDILRDYIAGVFNERSQRMIAARCSNIADYNRASGTSGDAPIPPIVVLVDEFADLVDQLSSSAEKNDFYSQIRRIAQMGRKRGVHLVLCTQRPSANLIPTDIRTLMNGRVALRLSDAASSRMILDEAGAEQLQMGGDILFKKQNDVSRCQGYYIERDDIEYLVQKITNRT